jgi:nucleoside-diphosphate-sugar epimerase
MKILITGGGGFLGSRLAQALKAKDPQARITLLDVAFPPGLTRQFNCLAEDVSSPGVDRAPWHRHRQHLSPGRGSERRCGGRLRLGLREP